MERREEVAAHTARDTRHAGPSVAVGADRNSRKCDAAMIPQEESIGHYGEESKGRCSVQSFGYADGTTYSLTERHGGHRTWSSYNNRAEPITTLPQPRHET